MLVSKVKRTNMIKPGGVDKMSDKLKEAYEKALEINEKNRKVATCLEAGVCPICAGENIEQYTNDQGFKFSDQYECSDCNTIIEKV